MDEAEALARHHRGAMMAAAGCGKTHIIGTAVAKYGGKRELVLTHTHAGVAALRRRLVEFKVPAKAYHVDTIAGWALRLASAFPKASGLSTGQPRTSSEYDAVYGATNALLKFRPFQEIVRASYSGTYVDEYQDCTVEQHALVLAIASVLPCRVLGDPLQGIFDFGNNRLIRWNEDVAVNFDTVPGPTRPRRWETRNPTLGAWLQVQRAELESGRGLRLDDAPVTRIDVEDRTELRKACWRLVGKQGESVVVVGKVKEQCYAFAKQMSGRFSCIEPIDATALVEAAHSIESSTGFERAIAVIDFASACTTKVTGELNSIRAAFSKGRSPNRDRCKHKSQLDALLQTATSDSLRDVLSALDAIRRLPGLPSPFRRELLDEMYRALRETNMGEWPSVSEAVWQVRNRTRRGGRKLPRCAAGTTLLVKGLEFDHAVVLDADRLDTKNLYVVITRGAKSLTIVSKSGHVQPRT